jgi:HlyD family secretion protein
MKKKRWTRFVPLLLALAIVAALVYAFLPGPALVDAAGIGRGRLMVTVNEDGRTRIRDRYIVSAPLNGRLQRIELRAGDRVQSGETIIATIEPSDPSLLDPRALAEAKLRVQAAEARLKRADPELTRAAAELEFAQQQLRLRRDAAELNAVSQQALEEAQLLERTRAAELRAAEYNHEIAQYELQLAEAALSRTQADGEQGAGMEIRSPITGRVLRVIEESATIVQPGMPLVELGDPQDLEVVVDVLSRDAVRIQPGARVILEHWGGEHPLEARVRLVEPAGFTKISALGVEEQRVNIIIDLVDVPQAGNLGDGYRVEARIVVWEDPDALQVPIGALFRVQAQWSVYLVENDRAVSRPVDLGHRTDASAQVLGGLAPGDVVILHPSDSIQSGARVRLR